MINNTYLTGRTADGFARGLADSRRKLKKAAAAFLLLLLLPLMLVFGDLLRESMLKALKLCMATVVPSLFPFVVANEFFISSGAAKTIGKPFSGIMKKVFRLSGACASAILTGIICGYPSGAACAFKLYEMGECTADEAERCVAIASNAGPAFVICGIGGAMLGDTRLGVIIWCSAVAVSLASGLLLRFTASKGLTDIAGKKEEKTSQDRFSNPKADVSFGNYTDNTAGERFSAAAAISRSAIIMIKICAFITVFSILADLAGAISDLIWLGTAAGTFLRGIFELTSSAVYAARSLPALYAAVVIAAAVGWSGLSVHLQTSALLPRGLSLRRYYIVKLLSAPASAALCAVIILLMSN